MRSVKQYQIARSVDRVESEDGRVAVVFAGIRCAWDTGSPSGHTVAKIAVGKVGAFRVDFQYCVEGG